MAKLKPRARLIRTIGDKLISGPEAAIIELVKNSYDADSPMVDVKIVPPKHKDNNIELPVLEHGYIEISDKGHGMTYDEIISVWLEPATDVKAKQTTSRSGNRDVLGAKGVGRFASSRLGKKIKITSIAQNKNALEKSILNLNWEIFESVKYLEDIDIDIRKETLQSNIAETGVSIKVTELNDVWGETRLEELIHELRRLATPQIHEEDSFNITLNLSAYTESDERKEYLEALKKAKNREDVPHKSFSPYDFDGSEFLIQNNRTLQSLTEDDTKNSLTHRNCSDSANRIRPFSLGEHCDYRVKGSFDEGGSFFGTLKILRGDKIPVPIELNSPKLNQNEKSCGAIDIDLKLYDFEAESIKRLFKVMGLNYDAFSLKEARKFIADNTGIGIYRNAFRVRPYGHHDHDWLNLEKRRVQNPSHRIGHAQIGGSIDISSETKSGLIERSSREGLEQNGSFKRLKSLITNLLLHIEAARFSYREKAEISRAPKKDFKTAFEIASLDNISEAIKSSHALSSEEKLAIQKIVNKTSSNMDSVLKGMDKYLKLLESRVSLGNVVAQVLHEGRTYISPVREANKFFERFSEDLTASNEFGDYARERLPNTLEAMKLGADGIYKLFDDIDPISGRKRAKPQEFNLIDVIKKVERLTQTSRSDAEVFVKHQIPSDLRCFGFAGDMQAALLNLFTNAIHWLSTEKTPDKKILLTTKCHKGVLSIFVTNNGPKIQPIHHERLFNAGFTLKTAGHGLGLVIAREAMRNSNGDLEFDTKSEDTTFILTIPTKAEKEVSDAAH
ncbi:sensor histidine kinase [Pseudoalteromonas piscicida]|uniref:sensor histidine kinase n=1 Tax=Pseudoalteromonas piscicida TaxID=43662 RepID=UPI001C96095A|nr:sensor histidine kinase [Pseudoalteromonas piscicida]QZO14770.1 ATP-binding protein [Pseudoalteromonas piscicida]